MQEEVNQKTICLIIQGGKISASVLKASLMYCLRQMEKQQANINHQKAVKAQTPAHGKQSLEQLTASGEKLTNIQITNKNIGTFDRVARKYCIDYHLSKNKTTKPPTYYVFFRAKDVDSMTAAFNWSIWASQSRNPTTSRYIPELYRKTPQMDSSPIPKFWKACTRNSISSIRQITGDTPSLYPISLSFTRMAGILLTSVTVSVLRKYRNFYRKKTW